MASYVDISTIFTNGISLKLKDGRTFSATAAQIQNWSEKNVKDHVLAKIADLTDLYVHKNRNGTWCIATGAAPEVWPEDEVMA